nr:hypothetical protein [Tanacetum cinerariifolium]
RGGGNHKEKDGGKSSNLQSASSYEKQIVSDHGKGTTPNGKCKFLHFNFTGGNGAHVATPLESIRAISERLALRMDCRNNPLILKKLNPDVNLQKKDVGSVSVRVKFHGVPMMAFSEDGSSNARAMIDLRADEELKDSIVVAMPKLVGEGFNMCNKIVSDMEKDLNNPKQATRGVLIGEMGRNGRNSKSAEKGSLNLVHGSSSNNPIIDTFDKLEHQNLDGKFMFVDNDGNSLVPTGNVNSVSEVEVVLDETTNLMVSTSFKGRSDRGYGQRFLNEVTKVMVLIACWNNGEKQNGMMTMTRYGGDGSGVVMLMVGVVSMVLQVVVLLPAADGGEGSSGGGGGDSSGGGGGE